MKKIFLRIALVAVAALATTITAAAASTNYFDSSSLNYSKQVKGEDATYVYQKISNPFVNGTYIIMNTSYRPYTVTGSYDNTFNFDTYYGCQPWSGGYNYRYARVTTYDKSGKQIHSSYDYANASDVTVSANLNDQSYGSSVIKIKAEGKCTVYNTPSLGYEGDCGTTCTLNLTY